MRPVYGRSPWLDRVPKSKVPSYAKHHGDLRYRRRHHRRRTDRVRDGLRRSLPRASTWRCSRPIGLGAAARASARLDYRRAGTEFLRRWKGTGPSAQHGTPGKRGGGPRSISRRCIRRLDLKCQLGAAHVLLVAQTRPSRPHSSLANRRRAATPGSTARSCRLEVDRRDRRVSAAAAVLQSRDSATIDPLSRHARPGRCRRETRRADLRAVAGHEDDVHARGGHADVSATPVVRARRIIVATGTPSRVCSSRWRGISRERTAYPVSSPSRCPPKVRKRSLGIARSSAARRRRPAAPHRVGRR